MKDVCEAYNVLAIEAKQVLIDRALHPHLEAFAAYVECLAETYERLKQERGAVDFEDLQLLARDVLRSDPAARTAYRFRRLYVDEAQDVNPLQDDLIELLAAGAERVLRVGDEQQSIYRFRWADVECFRTARDRAHGFPLRENYRSQAEVLEPLNAWFAPDPGWLRAAAGGGRSRADAGSGGRAGDRRRPERQDDARRRRARGGRGRAAAA